jgi:phosphate acetyltransferase
VASYSPFWQRKPVQNGSIPRIAFADAGDPRVLAAVQRISAERIAVPVLVGSAAEIKAAEKRGGMAATTAEIIDQLPPLDHSRAATLLAERQSRKGISADNVAHQLEDPLYRAIALLLQKKVDGLIAGSLRPTADIVRAALQCVGPKAGHKFVSGHFLIESDRLASADRTPFLFADCAVVPEPSPRILAAIAQDAADAYKFFTGAEPRVAMLSFSTRGSAEHELVDRIREAVKLARQHNPSLVVDGEIQLDAAIDAQVAEIKKAADSPVAGRANVFVFPTLEAGNIGYKLVQRFSNARIAGPLLWGLDRPMSDLSRGCTVEEITDTAACLAAMVRGKN